MTITDLIPTPSCEVDGDALRNRSATSGTGDWVEVCRVDDLTPDRGVAVLVHDRAVAVFQLAATTTEPASVHAVDHHDPASGAGVIARGLVGSQGGRTYVASPLHRHRYDLATGECLDLPALALDVWPCRVEGDAVLVGAFPRST